jgi:hypothetical protein
LAVGGVERHNEGVPEMGVSEVNIGSVFSSHAVDGGNNVVTNGLALQEKRAKLKGVAGGITSENAEFALLAGSEMDFKGDDLWGSTLDFWGNRGKKVESFDVVGHSRDV